MVSRIRLVLAQILAHNLDPLCCGWQELLKKVVSQEALSLLASVYFLYAFRRPMTLKKARGVAPPCNQGGQSIFTEA